MSTALAHARVPETSTCRVPRDVSRKLAVDFVCDNDVVARGKLTACLMVKLLYRLGLVTAKPLAHSTAC